MSKKELKTFAVPVVWSMIGNIFVSAYSKEEALKYARETSEILNYRLIVDQKRHISKIAFN